EIMQQVAPLGPVYQAGTLSGNPVAVAAGLTTLQVIVRDDIYPALEASAARLADGLAARAAAAGVPVVMNRVGAMFTGFFRAGEVHDYDDARASDLGAFAEFHQEMLTCGVYLAPSQFEASFVSVAHDPSAIDHTLAAAEAAFA